MFDLEKLRHEGAKMTSSVGNLLEVNLAPETAKQILENALGENKLQLYRLAVLYANESDRCRSADAYFSASLMVASAIETLLALICLMSQKAVEPLAAYRNIRSKKKVDFEHRILSAFFEDLILIASDLNWVPSEVVDRDILKATTQDFPLIAANLYPLDSESDRQARLRDFEVAPGVEMLRILHDMRNLIHGPRWPRTGIKTDPTSFEADCKFSYVVSYQVMMCLFETLIRMGSSGLAEVESLLEKMPPEYRALARSLALKRVGLQ